ncbi:MAG TPA: adenylate/guanylate cyclase domain-containing protein [Candidatus Methylacidiphilales bacterium]|jgi:PAS domain S-box-containing protein|nr:adenylate/guanylate cyclase domain-containing protein [Candidatus Methylacidiphilales bacterium]
MNTILLRYRREALVFGIGALYILGTAIDQHFTANIALIRVLDNARWTTDCFLASLLTLLGRREAAREDRRARHWFFLGWFIYTIGQISWDIQMAIGWNPFPAPSDLFYLSLSLCLTIGLLSVLLKGLTKGETRAVLLDLVGIVVMALTLTLALYLPLWGNASVLANVAAVLYPVLYLTTLGVCILTILTRRISLGFGSVLTLVGLAGWAFCWLNWNLRTLLGQDMDAIPIGYWFSVYALMLGAGLGKWRTLYSANPAYSQWSLRVQRLLPLLLVLGACVALVFGNYHFKHAVRVVIDIGAVTMMVLAAARQSLVLYEQDQILEAERKLRQSEHHLQQIVSNSSDLIYGVSVEPDGSFRYNSLNAVGEALGLKLEHFVGKEPNDCFPKEIADRCLSNYRQCAESNAPVAFDLLMPTPSGMAWFETALVPVKDEKGRVTQINAIARNITARKADMEAMASLNTELEERVALRTEELGREKEKTEQLLLNVLPLDIADELKKHGKVEARAFNSVTVAFTDFVDFTKIAESLSPSELVHELDSCFCGFDDIIARHGIEKLKTIGDSYMFAAGIPVASPTHAVDCILVALEMQAYIEAEKKLRGREGRHFWAMRMGIHTGSIMGGVIGNKKFAYDIWGDTVNTASRMESSGLPGQVNVSQATHEIARDFFEFEPRGKIATKRKGELEMFIVLRIRPELSDETGKPNEDFRNLYQELRHQS